MDVHEGEDEEPNFGDNDSKNIWEEFQRLALELQSIIENSFCFSSYLLFNFKLIERNGLL